MIKLHTTLCVKEKELKINGISFTLCWGNYRMFRIKEYFQQKKEKVV